MNYTTQHIPTMKYTTHTTVISIIHDLRYVLGLRVSKLVDSLTNSKI